jgi:subtilisin family serine protease
MSAGTERSVERGLSLVVIAVGAAMWAVSAAQPETLVPIIHPTERAVQVPPATAALLLKEALDYVEVPQARTTFKVSGRGLTVAVLDTGLNVEHVDFRGAIKATVNFSTAGSGPDRATTVTDSDGHGTNVAGIIVANGPARVDPTKPEALNEQINKAGMHRGVATGASLVALKVFPVASFTPIEDALQWVLDNYRTHAITVVNMSIQTGHNFQNDDVPGTERMRKLVGALTALRIPVVIAAGNAYAFNKSAVGMSYPGIIREGISVGAVFDAPIPKDRLPDEYPDLGDVKAIAFSARRGQITPFSQRYPETAGPLRTDVFAPGAYITSSGTDKEFGESFQGGTSQAAPIVSGLILLMQEWYREDRIRTQAGGDAAKANALRANAINDVAFRPTVAKLVDWLRSGESVTDNYGDDDNVTNTNASYRLVKALAAFAAMTKDPAR